MGHLLVVDLEATCWDKEGGVQTTDLMEVIEFGCVVSTWEGDIVESFSQLVRPVERPVLTTKCIELTSITQAMVDDAPLYAEGVELVDNKLRGYEFDCWLSWGNYDRNQLTSHKDRSGFAPDFLSLPHVNFRDVYKRHKGNGQNAHAHAALADCGLMWRGTQHRAEVDAYNYARLIGHMSGAITEVLSVGSFSSDGER